MPSYRRFAVSALCVVAGTCLGQQPARSLRFFAKPFRVYQGDAVVFSYLQEDKAGSPSTVRLQEITSWKWDFDGNVVNVNNVNDPGWDVKKTLGVNGVTVSEINATWYASYNAAAAVNGVYSVTPRLQVTTASGTYTQTGVTEDVVGFESSVDPQVKVLLRSVGDENIIVDFSANPRLAEVHTAQKPSPVRFYSDVRFAEGKTGTVLSYSWSFDGGQADSSAENPTVTYSSIGAKTVSLSVTYKLSGSTEVKTSLLEAKSDFIRIVDTPNALALGRAYRRGFPETYDWDDIIKAYQALGAGNNSYVYFNHFEDAFDQFNNELFGDTQATDPENWRGLSETVNELLQGQTLVANQRLIEALRIKYPRIANFDPNNPPQTLPPPAGAREETAAIDTALLDYQLPIFYAASAVFRYGAEILRSRASEGAEQFPQFPAYISFLDPSLSQAPIPIKNEYWQLTTALERMGLGRNEKAKKLFRLSVQDASARGEAKEECKNSGMQSYLGMALLAAGQTERDFESNEGNNLLANIKNARDLFETINAGLNPLRNDGAFIPNESFTAIYSAAVAAVADAREAEINARQEERTYDHYQAELRQEQLNQRNSYITPLKLLTSIDPSLYNNLQTVDDQRDYRNVVDSRVEALLTDYPNGNPASVGELGAAVIALLDAGKGGQQARNDLINLYKRIDIAKWGNARVNATIENATLQLQATDLVIGVAEAFLAYEPPSGTSAGKPFSIAGGIIKGIQSSIREMIQATQAMTINDVRLEQEIRGMMLELENLGIGIERADNQVRQAQLSLDNQLGRMERLIVDLAHTRDTAANLYFQDPSFRVVVSQADRRADGELDYAVDKLYRLAKTLQYEWTEGYQNPVQIPISSYEPASLENPLFDKFTQIDSLFFIRGADEAKDYLDALEAWDSKLRRINVTSVRGPNHSGPITAEPISVREQILNLKPDSDRGITLDTTIKQFRNYLETKRITDYFNVNNPSLELEFSTTIEDNRFFPATGSRWNMRIASISAEIYAESGFNTSQVAEIDLIESGSASLRRFFAAPPFADDIMRMDFNATDVNRTAFAVAFPAKINGATGGRPIAEFTNTGLADRPIGATKWILRINTENPTNRNIDFSKIKDIVLTFTYSYGNPPEFPNF